jgi:hypothetical protein
MAAIRFTESSSEGRGAEGRQPASLALGGRQCRFGSGDVHGTSVGAESQRNSTAFGPTATFRRYSLVDKTRDESHLARRFEELVFVEE